VSDEVSLLTQEGVAAAGGAGDARLLVEIAAPELFREDWEGALPAALFGSSNAPRIIRSLPRPDPRAVIPLSLPIDLLAAASGDLTATASRLAGVFRYFRVTLAEEVTESYLGALLAARETDVIHLQGKGTWGTAGAAGGFIVAADPGGLSAPDGNGGYTEAQGAFLDAEGGALDAARLQSLLDRTAVRLLVLATDTASRAPLLDLAHRLLAAGGPAALVVAGEPDEVDGFLLELYFGIVHDQSLDVAVAHRHPANRAAASLLCAGGSEELLRISPLLEPLKERARASAERAKEIRRDLEIERRPPSFASGVGEPQDRGLRYLVQPERDVDYALGNLRRIDGLTLNTAHETGGMEPLRESFKEVRKSEKLLDRAEAATGRVVNGWFSAGDRDLEPSESLAARAEYRFKLQIGPPLSKSIVRRPVVIPEEQLEPFYKDEGLELRVILFSNDFEIPEPEQPLRLPRPPLASRTVTFTVRTPSRPGRARLRAGVYLRQNLLQSLLVTAQVTPRAEKREHGNEARVDFALSGNLRDVERYPERTLNIVANDSGDGTHAFAVVGTDLKWSLTLKEGPMLKAVRAARRRLEDVCATRDREGKPDRYRFDDDNRGKPKDFAADLRRLAYLGYKLFRGQVTREDPAREEELRKALGRQATIQVAVADSAEYVFPWALVYDKPLLRDEANNSICPTFLDSLRSGGAPGFLENQQCLTSGCPQADDNNVICPSGFWGFRNLIEQPISVSPEGSGEVPLEVDAHSGIRLLMAISRKLRSVNDHRDEMLLLKRLVLDLEATKVDIGNALRRSDLQVVYFFCHGGREDEDVWLGVGDGERIYDTDLGTWKIDWTTSRPLVFLNGCHTVDVTPDDLLDFNRVLAAKKASGVIGTEIFVPEPLARHFARGFFEGLARGDKIGDIIRRQRLLLLERYNPLGLIYTPYCHGDLHMVMQ
jgi:hypothetical protein